MHALVAAGSIGQEPEHALGIGRAGAELGRVLAAAVGAVRVDKHAVAVAGVAVGVPVGAAAAAELALCQVQVDVLALEQVVVDLVVVVDGADEVGADVALAAEGLEPPPHAHVLVGLVLGLQVLLLVGVDPLLDVDGARAVVEAVGYVGRLRVHLAHLADDRDLGDGVAVDGEVGARVRLLEVDELLDRHGAEGLVGEALDGGGKRSVSTCLTTGISTDEIRRECSDLQRVYL